MPLDFGFKFDETDVDKLHPAMAAIMEYLGTERILQHPDMNNDARTEFIKDYGLGSGSEIAYAELTAFTPGHVKYNVYTGTQSTESSALIAVVEICGPDVNINLCTVPEPC